jgi:hypothetical protein
MTVVVLTRRPVLSTQYFVGIVIYVCEKLICVD